jgi:hypothetical protein
MQRTNQMNTLQRITIFSVFFLCLASFAQPVSFNYGDELTWSGELGQTVSIQYKHRGTTKQIEGSITKIRTKFIYVADELIFITDILSISGSDTDAATIEETASGKTPKQNTKEQTLKPRKEGDLPMTVFMLPMEGTVGETMRSTELKVLAQYIDENYGPGQVIVLKINSGGGISWTWSDIKDLIFIIRENHRVIAWIESAISAAAMTAICCDEMYFTELGECGSCTGWSGSPNNPVSMRKQNDSIHEMEKVLARSSRTPYLAAPMVLSGKWLSYDKDPITGDFTYYYTDEGEFPVSSGDGLTLAAKQALDAGLSDGIANTEEELLALLHLEDAEINRYGEELFHDWEKAFEQFTETKEELMSLFINGDPRADTQKKLLNSRIKAGERILKWAKTLGEIALYNNLGDDITKQIKREILNLRRELQSAEG